jgi:hypothetical protein
MAEPTIVCPKCKNEIKLTESLAAPLIESTRQDYERRLSQKDLDKERKVIMKQWAKRDEQIERVMQSTVGMYGDLQGIAGKTIQEIEGLEMKALEEGGTISN